MLDHIKIINKIRKRIYKHGIQKYIDKFDDNFKIKEDETDDNFIKRLQKFVNKYHKHTFIQYYKVLKDGSYSDHYLISNKFRKMPTFKLKKDIGIITYYSFINCNDKKINDSDANQLIKLTNQQIKRWLSVDLIKGLIIDLRIHRGGSFYPIANAFKQYFSSMFAFKGNNYTTWISYSKSKDKLIFIKKMKPIINLFPVPIAVLVSEETSSSGEFSACIFYKKPNVKLFGKTTSGYLSANNGYDINENISLILTETLVETSDNVVHYDQKLKPDVITKEPLEDAIEWLNKKY